ncbi:hypothetical protein BHM03_00019212 [Ensete ventricosum]|nr:hypothetical protein BHM03_00019212 [Ensete ventricosum]
MGTPCMLEPIIPLNCVAFELYGSYGVEAGGYNLGLQGKMGLGRKVRAAGSSSKIGATARWGTAEGWRQRRRAEGWRRWRRAEGWKQRHRQRKRGGRGSDDSSKGEGRAIGMADEWQRWAMKRRGGRGQRWQAGGVAEGQRRKVARVDKQRDDKNAALILDDRNPKRRKRKRRGRDGRGRRGRRGRREERKEEEAQKERKKRKRKRKEEAQEKIKKRMRKRKEDEKGRSIEGEEEEEKRCAHRQLHVAKVCREVVAEA